MSDAAIHDLACFLCGALFGAAVVSEYLRRRFVPRIVRLEEELTAHRLAAAVLQACSELDSAPPYTPPGLWSPSGRWPKAFRNTSRH